MKLRDQYDWIVLGNHPGALLSAALVARLGLSVLVLPVFSGKGVSLAKNEQFVDHETNFLLGLGRAPRFSGLLSECLSRLGMLPAELELIQVSRSLPQVLTPELRVDFGKSQESTGEERLAEELIRELGKERAAALGWLPVLNRAESEFLSYWLQLPERLTVVPGKERRPAQSSSYSDIRKKVERDIQTPNQARWLTDAPSSGQWPLMQNALQDFFSGLWYGLTANDIDDPSLFALTHLTTLGRTGASFRGGMSAYRDFLLRLARRLGAHIPAKTECRRIFVDKGRFAGVQITGQGTMVSGNGAVVGCALSHFETLVTVGGRSLFKSLKKSPEPASWRFTLAFTVRVEAIPPGASPHLVWKEGDAPILEFEIVDPADYGARKPEHRVILARTLMPFTQESLQVEYQRMISARVLRLLSEIFPFVEEHVTEIYPDFRSIAADGGGQLREVYGFEQLADIPENLRSISPKQGKGVGSHSGIEGLFVATGESFPELGSLGGTVAALESVSWVAHRAGLAGPFA